MKLGLKGLNNLISITECLFGVTSMSRFSQLECLVQWIVSSNVTSINKSPEIA